MVYNSCWGCYDYSIFKNYLLNVVIIDKYNNVIFLLKWFIEYSVGMWYMFMVDEKYIDELVFLNFEYFLYVERYMEL